MAEIKMDITEYEALKRIETDLRAQFLQKTC